MRLASILLVVLSIASPSVAQRLPRTVVPSHYDLVFSPDFAAESFDGDVTIQVSIAVPTSEIVLHAAAIEIRDVLIEAGGEARQPRVTLEPEQQWVRLSLDQSLPPGPATIRIRYRGLLNRNLRGLYLGEANGKKYASTQMEATDAREAFPGFDEPSFKATFSITAIVDEGHTAISNGAPISDEPGPVAGKHTIRFATTPRMSTYLVALTIGDFQCSRGEADGIPLGICGTPEKMPLSKFAMDATRFILPWFNDYYGIRYPFGKLDQTGVADFRWGAMENAGAILYRDAYLFIDEMKATSAEKRGVAGIISHEIAHMWFGDIVTMRWWDDIWLNEGFATWIASKPLAAWQPGWKMPLREVAASGNAMNADSLTTSRKIRQDASSTGEIGELFDGIAYGKTAAVLRMIESYVGEEAMRRGVSSYLMTHAWGNTTFHDFSEAIAAASEAPVGAILQSFVRQPGVPLLQISSSCENGETLLEIRQQRYLSDPSVRMANDQTWTLPLCYSIRGTRHCEVIRDSKQTIRIGGCEVPFLNAGGLGYYVVEPSTAMTEALLASIDRLNPCERLVLLRDEWNLVRSGRRTIDQYVRVATAMQDEREPLVAEQLLESFEPIRRVAPEAGQPVFEDWLRTYLRPLANELGWSPRGGESEELRTLRGQVLLTLGLTGRDQTVLRQARTLIERDIAGKSNLDPELRAAVTYLAAAGGDRKLYDTYLAQMRLAKTPSDYYRFLYALAFFPEPALIERTFNLALSESVKTQDASGLIARLVTGNPRGPAGPWNLVESNWSRIEQKLPETMRGGILASAATFCDPAAADRVRTFYEAHPIESAARTTAQSLERISQCIALREMQSEHFRAWAATTGTR